MRLSIELTDQQHQAIKAYAVLQGMSIKDFVLDRVFTEDMLEFSDKTRKVLAASEAGNELHRYNSVDDFISDMGDA